MIHDLDQLEARLDSVQSARIESFFDTLPRSLPEAQDSRIFEGESVSSGAWSVVRLTFWRKIPGAIDSSFSCTGTVVSPMHVLTAAHCLSATGYDGIVLTRMGSNTNYVFDTNNSFVRVHPKYAGGAQMPPLRPRFDLALVKLEGFDFASSGFNRAGVSLDLPETDDRLRIRGAGLRHDSATKMPDAGEVQVPESDGRIRVRYVGNGYLSARATKSVRACKADSGGPVISFSKYGKTLVEGVFSGYYPKRPKDYCPAPGETQSWATPKSAIQWLVNNMRTDGIDCSVVDLGDREVRYLSCD